MKRELIACGVEEEVAKQELIEFLVFDQRDKRRLPGCRYHCTRQPLGNDELAVVEGEILIPQVEVAALQAAQGLSFVELVEYYYELCGCYALLPDNDYRERAPLTSVEQMKRYFDSATGAQGIKQARRALSYVRDGCRSPMETAFVLMLALPKAEGGLGIRQFDVDCEVPVLPNASHLTRRARFYLDAFLFRSRTGIEYDGFYHDNDINRAIDEEKRNALAAMGYRTINVNRYSFFDAASFQRIMAAIQHHERIYQSALPQNFTTTQEQLRKFVLRRYLAHKSNEDQLRSTDCQAYIPGSADLQDGLDSSDDMQREVELSLEDDPSYNPPYPL